MKRIFFYLIGIGVYLICPIDILAQSSRIRALPPENITATSFEARASEILSTLHVKGYVIDVALDSTFSEASFVPGYRRRHDRLRFSATTALISELDPATTYYFRFVEIDTATRVPTSEIGRAVGFSNVQKVTTLDSPIPGSPKPALTNITRDGFTLRWPPVPKATHYLVDVWNVNYGMFPVIKEIATNQMTTAPTFSIQNIYHDSTRNDRHRYRVRAANSAGIGLASDCGECICIYTNPFFLRRSIFGIDSSLDTKWVLDAIAFGQLPQSPTRDSTYISLEVRHVSSYAFTILNKPDQEQLVDTVWVETDQEYRNQLTCGNSAEYNFPFPPGYLILHLKRKEDVQYFIQQYGRNAVRYTWDFVPSSPMFYRYSLVNTTTSTRSQQMTEEVCLSLTPNPSADVATVALLLPAPLSVRLTLHDALGREVRTIADGGIYPAGQQEFSTTLDGLPSGIYFVRGNIGGQVVVRRLAVVR